MLLCTNCNRSFSPEDLELRVDGYSSVVEIQQLYIDVVFACPRCGAEEVCKEKPVAVPEGYRIEAL